MFDFGATSINTTEYLLNELAKDELVDTTTNNSGEHPMGARRARLTLKGWGEYDRIRRGMGVGKQEFLAMPFRQDLNDTYLLTVLKAAKETGFELKRVDLHPRTDLIDLLIQNDLDRARFVVIELSHDNLGAYWEAGYAHGQRKPVIYTCHEDWSDNTHFDVNHYTHIRWSSEKLEDLANSVKAVIRHEFSDAI